MWYGSTFHIARFELHKHYYAQCKHEDVSNSLSNVVLMGNCCGGTATVPSLPQAPAPPDVVAMNPVPPPVLSNVSADRSSIPASQPPSRTRSRTGSRADSTSRSLQDPDPRTRRKSAPEPPSSLPEVSRPRTKSAANPRKTVRSESRPMSTGERDV